MTGTANSKLYEAPKNRKEVKILRGYGYNFDDENFGSVGSADSDETTTSTTTTTTTDRPTDQLNPIVENSDGEEANNRQQRGECNGDDRTRSDYYRGMKMMLKRKEVHAKS